MINAIIADNLNLILNENVNHTKLFKTVFVQNRKLTFNFS